MRGGWGGGGRGGGGEGEGGGKKGRRGGGEEGRREGGKVGGVLVVGSFCLLVGKLRAGGVGDLLCVALAGDGG